MHTVKDFTFDGHWPELQKVVSEGYTCGYCGAFIASDTGISTDRGAKAVIRICHRCNGPTFFDARTNQWPAPRVGARLSGIPEEINSVYDEARTSATHGAHTGAVMLCRKILMHVAVGKDAPENLKFEQYVKWLIKERYVPRGAEEWLHYVRLRANEANHEIIVMTRHDAGAVLRFTEALLRSVYELPDMVPIKPPKHNDEADQGAPGSAPGGQ